MVFEPTGNKIQQQIEQLESARASGAIPDLSEYDLKAHFMFGHTNNEEKSSKPAFLPESLTIDGQRYDYLARGAQAAVYCNENQEVVKRSYTLAEGVQLLQNQSNPIAKAQENIDHFLEITGLTKEHLKSGRLDPGLVANARIDSEGRIWQSWAPSVEVDFIPDAISKYEPRKVKELIDKFAECFVSGFKSGLCETECSLFSNYSLRGKDGALTIPDFGNVTYDYNEAKASVAGRISEKEIQQFLLGEEVPLNQNWPDWFKKGQVRETLRSSPQLFRYYVQRMSETVNEQTLEANWPKEYR